MLGGGTGMADMCWLHIRLRSCGEEGHGGSLLASL